MPAPLVGALAGVGVDRGRPDVGLRPPDFRRPRMVRGADAPGHSDPGGQSRRVPPQEGHRLREGEPVGHAGHVGDCSTKGARLPAAHAEIVWPGGRDQMGSVTEVLDQRPEHPDDCLALGHRTRAQVDVLVIAGTERGQGLGRGVIHADPPGGQDRGDHGFD